MKYSIILDTSADPLFRMAALFSVFLLFAGHNAPGGGFVGGLVFGAALVLRFMAGGDEAVRRVIPMSPAAVVGVGVTISSLTAVAGWFLGGELLESVKWEVTIPVIGVVKATSALFFDLGVYIVVVGLVLTIIRTLGTEDPERGEVTHDPEHVA